MYFLHIYFVLFYLIIKNNHPFFSFYAILILQNDIYKMLINIRLVITQSKIYTFANDWMIFDNIKGIQY